MNRWLVGPALLVVAYAMKIDYCLIATAPKSSFTSYGTVGLGFAVQLVCLAALLGAFNRYLTSPKPKVQAVVVAVFFLWFSIDIMAYGLYNTGLANRLESSRRIHAVIGTCCHLLPGTAQPLNRRM